MGIDSLLMRAHKKEKQEDAPVIDSKGDPSGDAMQPAVDPRDNDDSMVVAGPNPVVAGKADSPKGGGISKTVLDGVSLPTLRSADPAEQVQPEEFKERLDKLDALIQAEQGINSYTMDAVRGYVKTIMVDLQKQPELDSCLIDRDIHNVLHFIRTVKDNAAESRTVAKAKREVKSSKAKGLANFQLTPISFELPKGLEMLGKLKT